ncbi:MAG: sporulation/spore germination protein [Nostocaceae cyanobacterium]|nr:sporulation/spore germination protein [Nostocaceae cyanobacterium]
MNKIIKTNPKYISSLIVGAIALSLSGCGSTAKLTVSESQIPTNLTKSVLSTSIPADEPTEKDSTPEKPTVQTKPPAAKNTPKTTTVTVYTSDSQCQDLIPQKLTVPAEESMVAAVGKILEQRDTADFSLSGYRVSVNNGVAVVDFRVTPNQQRQIASLTNCEQFALIGSIRKTLTSNPQWKVKEVRFTQQGEEIVF